MKSTHSTPRSEARGMPFDKLKAPSRAEGLRVDTERRFLPRFRNRGLAPSNVSNPVKLKAVLFIIGFMILGSVAVWGEEWKVLERTDEEAVSYDAGSVTRPSRDTVRVLVRTVFSEKGIDMHVKEFGERFKNLNHVKDLLEFNCVDKKTRVLQSTIYAKDENILVSDTSSELEWRAIIPDSLGETLYKEVCK